MKQQKHISANAKKFIETYRLSNEISDKITNRHDLGLELGQAKDLLREYKRLNKRLDILSPKIIEFDYINYQPFCDLCINGWNEWLECWVGGYYNLAKDLKVKDFYNF